MAVFWYCPKHGYVESHPDDGRDRQQRRRRRRAPSFASCPGPYDDDRGEWCYEGCRLDLRRRIIPARRVARLQARV